MKGRDIMIYVNDPEKIPVPEKEEYWDRSEKDYRKKINLISGLTPHITAGDENDAAAANHNTPPSKGTLTDGNIPTSVSYDEKDWFKFARGQSREIIFDITKISTVTNTTLSSRPLPASKALSSPMVASSVTPTFAGKSRNK